MSSRPVFEYRAWVHRLAAASMAAVSALGCGARQQPAVASSGGAYAGTCSLLDLHSVHGGPASPRGGPGDRSDSIELVASYRFRASGGSRRLAAPLRLHLRLGRQRAGEVEQRLRRHPTLVCGGESADQGRGVFHLELPESHEVLSATVEPEQP
ncbi:MAG: hypothetical protein MJD61_15930 [Proteobacteria bacterium]|nr:hypothetical protein [Pseudomonadota bacterium]